MIFAMLYLGILGFSALHAWRHRKRRQQFEVRFDILSEEKGQTGQQTPDLLQLGRAVRMNNRLSLLNSVYAFD